MSLQYMLSSLRDLDAPSVILYDLGLLPHQRQQLVMWSGLSVRRFRYDKYPPHVDVKRSAGHYAWKPIIVDSVLREKKSSLLWCDAGSYFKRLDLIASLLQDVKGGIWVGKSSGTMDKLTHPGMFKEMKADPKDYADRENAEAGLIGFRYQDEAVRRLVADWAECAMRESCIAPPGSSRLNHRQDQSVLSLLLHRYGIQLSERRQSRIDGILTACDRSMYNSLTTRHPAIWIYKAFCQ